MANKMQAVVKYSPRIAPAGSAHNDDVVEHMMERSGASRGECFQSVQNFVDMLCYFLRRGTNVLIDDLGTFSVEIDLKGDFNIHFRPDADLRDQIRTGFHGVIENNENIGKTMADLIASGTPTPRTPTTRYRQRKVG